ncbi:MAG: hypothetical protein EP346_08365 [Bacteroidetes bacterium]|nr:MAG: hypothetical protein EP346_08365 [Bacteroidota bacterium]
MSWLSDIWKSKDKDPVIGVCLSGGGARGVIHIGYLKALEERDIPIHSVSGTSMGAIVSLLSASGLNADDMLEAFIDLDIDSNTKRFKLLKAAFQQGLNTLYDRLHGIVGVDDFSELQKDCYLTASELRSGSPVIFKSGNPVHAALASASIPLIFHPYKMGDKVYVDGGLFNNFPIDPLIESCTHILGSHANHLAEDDDLGSTMKIADRVFRLAIFQNVRYRMELCDSFIDPSEARKYTTLGFDPSILRELFQIGYEAGKAELDQIEKILKSESEKHESRSNFTEIIKITHTEMKEK